MVYRNSANDTATTNAIINSTSSGMPKYGHIWSAICSVIYGIASFFIIKSAMATKDEENSHNAIKWTIGSILVFIILLNAIIYFAKDKSTEQKKAKTKEIVGWIAVGPWVVILIFLIIMGSVQFNRTTY